MNKKAITILGAIFLLIVGTLGFLIYQRRGNDAENTNTNTNTNTQPPPPTPTPVEPTPTPTPTPTPVEPTPTPTPTPPTGETSVKPVRLLEERTISPILFYQGNGIAYFNSQGQLFQADMEGSGSELKLTNTRELGVPLKSAIQKVYWPSAGNNYIAEMSDANGRKSWSVYVSDKGAYIDLPKEVTAVNWMPDGEQILYLWLSNGKTNLNISPADLSTWQVVTDIWENDDDIAVSPDGRTIIFWRKENTESVNKINMVTPDGKLFRTVVKDGYNSGAAWSPDSQKFVFSRKGSNGKWQLWTANLFTGEVQNLNMEGMADNIVWGSDSRVVYVPVAAGSGRQNLVRIEVATSTQQQILLDGSVEAVNLFISTDGKRLFFKNNLDGGLYYVDVSSLAVSR